MLAAHGRTFVNTVRHLTYLQGCKKLPGHRVQFVPKYLAGHHRQHNHRDATCQHDADAALGATAATYPGPQSAQ